MGKVELFNHIYFYEIPSLDFSLCIKYCNINQNFILQG